MRLNRLLIVAIVAVAACDDDERGGTAAGDVALVSDGQAATILTAMNTGEIQIAQAALPRLTADPARNFANMMIEHHTRANADQIRIMQQENIAGAESDVSAALQQTADSVTAQLESVTPGTADVTYMDSQVRMHREALVLIDCLLVPSTDNEPFKTFIRDTVRPTVQSHWEEARAIRGTLAGASGGNNPPPIQCGSVCDDTSTELAPSLRAPVCGREAGGPAT
jgi:putative membrane protein